VNFKIRVRFNLSFSIVIFPVLRGIKYTGRLYHIETILFNRRKIKRLCQSSGRDKVKEKNQKRFDFQGTSSIMRSSE